MKRIWFYLAFAFLLVLAVGFGNIWMLNYGTDELNAYLDPLEAAIHDEDWTKAGQLYQQVDQCWRHWRSLWQITIDHKETENIETAFAGLEAGIVLNDRNSAITALYTFRHNVEHIPYVEKLSWQNIL